MRRLVALARVDPEIHAVGASIATRYHLVITVHKNRVVVRLVEPSSPDLVGTLRHVQDSVLRAGYFCLERRRLGAFTIKINGEPGSVHRAVVLNPPCYGTGGSQRGISSGLRVRRCDEKQQQAEQC